MGLPNYGRPKYRTAYTHHLLKLRNFNSFFQPSLEPELYCSINFWTFALSPYLVRDRWKICSTLVGKRVRLIRGDFALVEWVFCQEIWKYSIHLRLWIKWVYCILLMIYAYMHLELRIQAYNNLKYLQLGPIFTCSGKENRKFLNFVVFKKIAEQAEKLTHWKFLKGYLFPFFKAVRSFGHWRTYL